MRREWGMGNGDSGRRIDRANPSHDMCAGFRVANAEPAPRRDFPFPIPNSRFPA